LEESERPAYLGACQGSDLEEAKDRNAKQAQEIRRTVEAGGGEGGKLEKESNGAKHQEMITKFLY